MVVGTEALTLVFDMASHQVCILVREALGLRKIQDRQLSRAWEKYSEVFVSDKPVQQSQDRWQKRDGTIDFDS